MVGTELFKKMKTLLAFVDSGILIADSSYDIVYANPSALRFLSKKIDELVGTPISSIFSKENWEKISESIEKVKQTNTPIRIHIEEKNKFMKLGVSPILVEEKYTGFILNMLDTTVEEHLLIQRSELTSMMINELKDPIYTLYDLFNNKQILKAEDVYVQQAKDSTRMLMNALETLLDINQLTSGVLNLEFDDVDILRVIKSCVKSIEPFAQKQEVMLFTSYKVSNSIIKLDREKFTKGLINLLSLAIKEEHEKDVLYIEVRNEVLDNKPYIMLVIANTGMGTAESIFENVTDKHTFSHMKDEEKLYIEVLTAKRLIQAHSGQLQATSEFGIGSSFVVTLPLAAA
ncbi:MAG: PAS domain-containing protein [Deltaproteobacteria bacterium]|nr:PAS domain-containing protein [Deltaproteobacteria bacterium]